MSYYILLSLSQWMHFDTSMTMGTQNGQKRACDSLGARVFGVFWFGELFRELVKRSL
jgi:hypothetical protein